MQLTTDIAKKILLRFKDRDLPCFSDTLIRLASLDPDSEYSVEELSSIILEDIGLTSKVLRSVNTFYYIRTGKEVSTVTQAILLLGFNALREIALNMAVLDLAEKGENDPLIKQLLSSFTAAHFAQSLTNDTRYDKETIFVKCLFYNLGRIILCLYDQKLYKEIELIEGSDPVRQDKVKKFLAYIGQGICELWSLPPSFKENLEGISNRSDKVNVIIQDCHLIARSFLVDTQHGLLTSTFKNLSDLAGISLEKLNNKLALAIKSTVNLSPRFKSALPHWKVQNIFEKIGRHLSEEAESSSKLELDDHSTDNFLVFLTQFTSLISQQTFTLEQIYLFACEAILRGLPTDRVLLTLLTKDKSCLLPRYAIGKKSSFLKENFKCKFPPVSVPLKSVFETNRAALSTWTNVCKSIVFNGSNNDISQKIVTMVPIIVFGKPIGCFFMDRAYSSNKFIKEDLMKAEAIRDLVVLGTQKR